MKKHYEFVKLSEKDMHKLRGMLRGDAVLRIPFAFLIFGILVYMGSTHLYALTDSVPTLLIYLLSLEIVLSFAIREIVRIHSIHRLHKSTLVNYIHSGKADESFYNEEIPDGFIIQILPVKYEDIQYCLTLIDERISKFKQALSLAEYLGSCLSSNDKQLVNKGVIYTEIVSEQLDMGNLAILSSREHLCNLILKEKS